MGSLGCFAHEVFEFGEDLFDWVEIGTVGRKVDHLRSHAFDGLSHPGDLVARQIVHHDQVTPTECGNQVLFNPGFKEDTIDRTVNHQRSR